MTNPHIEKAAREMEPQAFEDKYALLPFSASKRKKAIQDATIVWNLAIEEATAAAKRCFNTYAMSKDDEDRARRDADLCGQIEVTIRALSVEG